MTRLIAPCLLAVALKASAASSDSAYFSNQPWELKEGVYVILPVYTQAGEPDGEIRLLVGDQLEECFALSREHGVGYWSWANAGFEAVFPNKRFSYGNHADAPIDDRTSISGCHNSYRNGDFDALIETLTR